MRDPKYSDTWLQLANRAVVAFEEYVEVNAARNTEIRWSSTSQPGSGQVIFCVNGREVATLSREHIEEQFAKMDRYARERAERDKKRHGEIDDWLADGEGPP